jgi:MoaA/NifB/PqqE/SkfB family radical SAM enzyme
MTSKTICSAPTIGTSIIGGMINPCCWNLPSTPINNSKTITEQQYQFSEMQKGLDYSLPEKCNKCKLTKKEDAYFNTFNKIKSINVGAEFNPDLKFLHIMFNNKCNLACRMCSPQYSSLHFQEEFQIPKVYDFVKSDSVLYKSIFASLGNLEYLYLTGGESLLDEQSWKLINTCVEKDYAKNITLQINTNGTIKLNDMEIKTLKSFKKLDLHISIDGIETMAEYTRTGLIWDKWIKNFEKYVSIFPDLNVVITANVYNIFEIDKTVDFFESYGVGTNVNILTHPVGLDISSLDKNIKKELLKKYQNYNGKYYKLCRYLEYESKIQDTKNIIQQKEKNALGKYTNFKAYKDCFPEYWNKF